MDHTERKPFALKELSSLRVGYRRRLTAMSEYARRYIVSIRLSFSVIPEIKVNIPRTYLWSSLTQRKAGSSGLPLCTFHSIEPECVKCDFVCVVFMKGWGVSSVFLSKMYGAPIIVEAERLETGCENQGASGYGNPTARRTIY